MNVTRCALICLALWIELRTCRRFDAVRSFGLQLGEQMLTPYRLFRDVAHPQYLELRRAGGLLQLCQFHRLRVHPVTISRKLAMRMSLSVSLSLVLSLLLVVHAVDPPSLDDYHAACDAREQAKTQQRYDDWMRMFAFLVEKHAFGEGGTYTMDATSLSAQQQTRLLATLRARGWDASWRRLRVVKAEYGYGVIDTRTGHSLCRITSLADAEDAPDAYRDVMNLQTPHARVIHETYAEQPERPWYCAPCSVTAFCSPDWYVNVVRLHVPVRPRQARAVVDTSVITPLRNVTLNGERSQGTRFAWKQLMGVPVALHQNTSRVAHFVPPAVGPYEFELTVSAGETSESARVTVYVTGSPPRAPKCTYSDE